MVDYSIITFVIGVILGLSHAPAMSAPIPQMIVIFIWLFVEAILLCTWGTTPGKALLRVHIRREGIKPTFLQALSRSFSVWWLGVAAGIPIIMLVTMIVACVKLSSGKVTTWDRTGNFTVWHAKIGPIRILITIAIFVFMGGLMYLSMAAK